MNRQRKVITVAVAVVLPMVGVAWYGLPQGTEHRVSSLLNSTISPTDGLSRWWGDVRGVRYEDDCRPWREVAADLAAIGEPAVPHLAQALTDQDIHPDASSAAISALCKINSPSAAEALAAALQSKSPATRLHTVEAVERNRITAASDALLAVLRADERDDIRVKAGVALARFGDDRARRWLEELLAHLDVYIRRDARNALDILNTGRNRG
jgi:hypothetical protein